MSLKSSHWSCLKSFFRATQSVLQQCWSGHILEHSKAMNEPEKRSHEFERSKFRQQVQSHVWCLPEDVWPSDFEKCLKKCLRGNLTTKKYSFPKNCELCAKFCGVRRKPGWRYLHDIYARNCATETAKSKFQISLTNILVDDDLLILECHFFAFVTFIYIFKMRGF